MILQVLAQQAFCSRIKSFLSGKVWVYPVIFENLIAILINQPNSIRHCQAVLIPNKMLSYKSSGRMLSTYTRDTCKAGIRGTCNACIYKPIGSYY